MKDNLPDNTPSGRKLPEQTSSGEAEQRRSRQRLRKPNPDRLPGGDEPTEREHNRARRDMAEGSRQDHAPEPDRERADRAADRGGKTRPSVFP